jgi:CBS domain-containing protein
VKAKDIMTRMVLTVPPECNVEYAAHVMKENQIGLLAVGDRDNIVGVVTDRDITIRVTADGKDPKHTEIRDVMSPKSFYCFDDEDLEDACLTMEEKHVRRLIVLDHTHTLVGILSLDDVAVRTTKEKLTGYVLSKVAKTSSHL